MIEIQPGANEPRFRAGRWPAHPKHRSEAIQPNEQQSVEGPKNRSLRGIAPQHIDLLPENQELRLKPRAK
jgi:hypothetical protein